MFPLRLCGGKPLVAVTRERRYVRADYALTTTTTTTTTGQGWLGSRLVSVLDSGAEGPGFKS